MAAVLILLVTIASAITIGSAIFRKPEKPRESIIRMGDMEQDVINTFDADTLIQDPVKSID